MLLHDERTLMLCEVGKKSFASLHTKNLS